MTLSYQTILFDFDGTIAYTRPGVERAIRFALRSVGVSDQIEPDVMRACIGPPLTESFVLRLGVPENRIEDALRAFHAEYDDHGAMYDTSLYDGILTCLTALKDMGKTLCVASSKNETACRAILSKLKADDFFDDICGASMDASVEKKSDVLALLFQRHPDFRRKTSLLIGDTIYDMKGAHSFGIDAAGVTWGFGNAADLSREGAIILFDHPNKISEYFAGHSKILKAGECS